MKFFHCIYKYLKTYVVLEKLKKLIHTLYFCFSLAFLCDVVIKVKKVVFRIDPEMVFGELHVTQKIGLA